MVCMSVEMCMHVVGVCVCACVCARVCVNVFVRMCIHALCIFFSKSPTEPS